MLGAPGSGKGTYAKAVAGKLLDDHETCLPIFSTGDMLRAEIDAGTDLGAKARVYADRGQLVPDQIVIDAVLSRLDREAAAAADPAHAAKAVLLAKIDDANARYKEYSEKSLDMEMEQYATPAERVNGEAATLNMGAAAMKAHAEAEALRAELSTKYGKENPNSDTQAETNGMGTGFGFILDGFPRTTAQAAALEAHRGGLHAPTTVVNVQLDKDVIVAKLLGRRVCTDCGTSYNVATVKDDERGIDMPAMAPPSSCASKMAMRSDDTEEVIEARLAVYAEETSPLIGFYEQRGMLVDFVVKKGMQDVDTLRKKIRKHEKLSTIAAAWAATAI